MEGRVESAKTITVKASKNLALVSVMSATLVTGKVVLSFVPNIEVVTTLLVVYAFVFGMRAVFASLVFCICDVFIYPPSLDVAISYFVYWNALALAVVLLKRLGAKEDYHYILLALFFTAAFGVLTTFFSHLIVGVPFIPTYFAGIPFYAAHLISTLVFMLAGFKPLSSVLEKLNGGIFPRS